MNKYKYKLSFLVVCSLPIIGCTKLPEEDENLFIFFKDRCEMTVNHNFSMSDPQPVIKIEDKTISKTNDGYTANVIYTQSNTKTKTNYTCNYKLINNRWEMVTESASSYEDKSENKLKETKSKE
jgi:hypothetical protein